MINNKKLHIQMFSIHGLVRNQNMELGYDADTGGQVKYVIELGRALSKNDMIAQIDLFTRLIDDPSVSTDYGNKIEQVNEKFRLIRIPCGPGEYIRKERLWPYLDEFVTHTAQFIEKEDKIPDLVHGHYPDAGLVALKLAEKYELPFVYTGHSLGRTKKNNLLKKGADEKELNDQLNIDLRIDVEEKILQHADRIICSTRHEIEAQYAEYENAGRDIFEVISPGIDIDDFEPYYHSRLDEHLPDEELLFARASIEKELNRFLVSTEKPLILSLCRPDERKNIEGLVKAYGEDSELQAMANIAIFAGIRKDIQDEQGAAKDVLTRMLLLMDKYNLYGKMAVPKKHDFATEVPELYRLAAEKGGVFVNPALNEPFGITILEASAAGLPVVATQNGGPKDIIGDCKNGLLVNPRDTKEIAAAIKQIITHPETWSEYSKNGILNTRKLYTWDHHARTYLRKIRPLIKAPFTEYKTVPRVTTPELEKKAFKAQYRMHPSELIYKVDPQARELS